MTVGPVAPAFAASKGTRGLKLTFEKMLGLIMDKDKSVSKTSEILSEYLRNMFYGRLGGEFDPLELDEEFVAFGHGLIHFARCFFEYNELAKALAEGNLGASIPSRENTLVSSLKSLHASLRHLTWQTQQVAKGDYTQRIDFMGSFSTAFNTMVEQLAERQRKLEEEIEIINRKSMALEQGNQLLSSITQYIQQQIIVMAKGSHEVLFMNDTARKEIRNDEGYLPRILEGVGNANNQKNVLIHYIRGKKEYYLSISSYSIEWKGSNAEALVISDVSDDKGRIKELMSQKQALIDSNYDLQETVYAKTKTVVELQHALLITMSELVEGRDNLTGLHIERTQNYLNVLLNAIREQGHAPYMQEISSWNIDLVLLSAQLHDVGKIAVPDSILRKPGKLTDEEYATIKEHAVVGERIIDKIQKLTTEQNFFGLREDFCVRSP